jgi:hypothetical protein
MSIRCAFLSFPPFIDFERAMLALLAALNARDIVRMVVVVAADVASAVEFKLPLGKKFSAALVQLGNRQVTLCHDPSGRTGLRQDPFRLGPGHTALLGAVA